mgnify:CR=1 FL=1
METDLKQTQTDFAQEIKNLKPSQESLEQWSKENEEMLAALFQLLKERVVKLRVRHNAGKNTWNAEIYFTETGSTWYYTNLTMDITSLVAVVSNNGYEPEYIEE